MVLMALRRTAPADDPTSRGRRRRGRRLAAGHAEPRRRLGGLRRDINSQVLTKVPFADHNAMLDPSCPDITARVLEALGGTRATAPTTRPSPGRSTSSGATQEPHGCWYGRWGVNYIYGTWQVLQGLQAHRLRHGPPRGRAGRPTGWRRSSRPAAAGARSCRSYDDPSLEGRGEPTASQTAWAVLGLIAAGRADGDAVRRGIEYLLEHPAAPTAPGTRQPFTGTGFPRVFYLKYHLYRLYFPLMALARYRGRRRPIRAPDAGALACRIPALPRSLDI